MERARREGRVPGNQRASTAPDLGLEHFPCLLCGGRRARTLWPANLGGGDLASEAEEFDYSYASVTVGVKRHHRIVRCCACGLIYVTPRPTREAGEAIYARLRDERYASLRAERVEHFERDVRQIEGMSRRGPLLDVGCGSGYFLEAASARGWRPAVGVELNRWMVELGREAGLDIREASLGQCRFPAGSFQVISFWDVLEHTSDPLAELREARRVIRPGGLLVLLLPDASSFWARFLRERWWAVIRMHLYYFTPATLARLLEMAGWRIEHRTTHPKEARLEYLANLLQHQPSLHRLAAGFLRRSGLGRRVLAVDPRDQMKVYARPAG